MKGAHGRMHAAYSYSRRRWITLYAVMVIVCSVLVCGILGLHRLRERRSVSLLIKQKDDQILSLHLLLQKERERMQEEKRKTEELKTEILRLGSQKAELNSRILDLQSTISSLREEQRAVETAFQEKQNEVRLLREKDQDSQVDTLTEELRRKEAEFGGLKQRLQLRGAEVGAVSDHEIQPSNATARNGGGDVQDGERKNARETEGSMTSKEETDRSSENGGTNADGSETEKKVDETERREMKEDEDGKIADLGQVQKSGEEGDEAHVTATDESSDKEMEVDGGRVKQEMQETTHKVRGKRGYLRRVKGKRWRSIAKQTQKRTFPSNAASTMADQALVQGDKLPDNGRGEATSNEGSNREERPAQNELRGSTKGEDNEDLSSNDLKNSSSDETRASLEESAKNPEIKIEDTRSANKDEVKNTEENEQSDVKLTEDGNEQQHTDLLGRKGGKPDAVQRGDSAKSELGEDSEEKEETDEQDF